MRPERRLLFVLMTWILCLASSSGQDFTIKKKKLTVLVEQNSECPEGVSVSASRSGRKLCVDYPRAAAQRLRMKFGTTMELEALWTFSVKTDSQDPVAVGMVSGIAQERFVSNPQTSGEEIATPRVPRPKNSYIKGDVGAGEARTTVISRSLPHSGNEHIKEH